MKTNNRSNRFLAAVLCACTLTVASGSVAFGQGESRTLTPASASSAGDFNVSQTVERIEVIVKTSRILTLGDRIPRFQVHNEEVLGATPISQNQLQVFAKTPGTTQINLWDTDDKLYTVDVVVVADARELEGILQSLMPLAALKVTPLNTGAALSGFVTNVDDVDKAVAIVEQYYPTVVNNVQVVGVQQVLLHTKIMEVSRTKFRDLGLDFAVTGAGRVFSTGVAGLLNVPGTLGIPGTAIADGANTRLTGGDFDLLIKALRQNDLVKMLAEPTVVATHGRPARFTVGGKVPYIVPSGNNAVAIEFEEFGTSVDFLPFVIGPGRVRLEIRPEVSEVDSTRSIAAAGINVPGFTQRVVDTSVEMQAGQTFAIAGLLQSRTESVVQATPFFGEIPYVGALFRRVQERRNDVELLITVTPELVAPMDPHEVPAGGPGLNSSSPTDCELFAFGHIEVPNSAENCGTGCSCGGAGCSGCSAGGAHAGHGFGAQGYGTSGGLPPGAIVPGSEPMVVGEGISISQP